MDRQGKLQPAPGPDQPFDKLETAVIALLNRGSILILASQPFSCLR